MIHHSQEQASSAAPSTSRSIRIHRRLGDENETSHRPRRSPHGRGPEEEVRTTSLMLSKSLDFSSRRHRSAGTVRGSAADVTSETARRHYPHRSSTLPSNEGSASISYAGYLLKRSNLPQPTFPLEDEVLYHSARPNLDLSLPPARVARTTILSRSPTSNRQETTLPHTTRSPTTDAGPCGLVRVEFLASFLFGIEWPGSSEQQPTASQATLVSPEPSAKPMEHQQQSMQPEPVSQTGDFHNPSTDKDLFFSCRSTSSQAPAFVPPEDDKPPDWIDPTDGHVWRAKYCVLEGEALFFYRDQAIAESAEAIQERLQLYPGWDDWDVPSLAAHGYSSPQDQSPERSHVLSQSPRNIPRSTRTVTTATETLSTRHQPQYRLWEKRVPLECVGAVRSTLQEYGDHSFALLAATTRDDDDEDDVELDRLILRAHTSKEMNEWLFQFHRCMASFVMDMVDNIALAGDLHQPRLPFRFAPHEQSDHSSHSDAYPHRIRSPVHDSTVFSMDTPDTSPVRSASSSSPHLEGKAALISAAVMSPRYHRMIMTSGSFRANNAPLSLGHGGRSSLRRRRLMKERSASHDFGVQLPFPVPSPDVRLGNSFPSSGPLDSSPETTDITATSSTHTTVFSMDTSPELCSTPSEHPETERPPPPQGKYVPPHKRNGANNAKGATGASTKYIPPHLRLNPIQYLPPPVIRSGNAHSDQMTIPDAGNHLPQDRYVSRHNRNNTLQESYENSSGDGNTPFVLGYRPATYAAAAEVCNENDKNLKLGGCADPAHVSGSIQDDQFIPRKASRLGKVRTNPFGYTSDGGLDLPKSGQLLWEIGAFSECGIRDYNEDSYLVTSSLMNAFSALNVELSQESTVWNSDQHPPGLFAIFDGHCGDHASRFAAERLTDLIYEETLAAIRDETSVDCNSQSCNLASVEEILTRVIARLDQEFCDLCVANGRDWESGTTALMAALVNEHLVIANLGDARGILGRSVAHEQSLDDSWHALPFDDYPGDRKCVWKEVAGVHSPIRDDERARIERANGWVIPETDTHVEQFQRMALYDDDVVDIFKRCFANRLCDPSSHRKLQTGRVCGELSVSRALGDRDFKASRYQNDTGGTDTDTHEWDSSHLGLIYPEGHNKFFVGDLISSKPEFNVALRVGQVGVTEEFLLLACDGLWDVMDAADAYRVARDLLFEKHWTARKTAGRLAELAVHLGSSDNITVVIVRFLER